MTEPIAVVARLIYMPIRQCDRDPRESSGGELSSRVVDYVAGYADARVEQASAADAGDLR